MEANKPPGLLLRHAARYDALLWLFTLGRESFFRGLVLDRAQLERGERVLDVGCGTGSLAIEAATRVGPEGIVCGVDASVPMVERARKKARRARLEVAFREAPAQALPYADANFDLVLCTLVFHHIGRAARETSAREMRRVLRPGGRVVVVDFEQSTRGAHGVIGRLHRHGAVPSEAIAVTLQRAGFEVVESGTLGYKGMGLCIATI